MTTQRHVLAKAEPRLRRRALPALLGCGVAALAASATAQQPTRLDPVEIVAPPIVESIELDRYGSAATIVSDRQIEDLNAYDLANALRRTPGVSISRYNPVGSFGGAEGGAVFIRGRGQSRPGADIKAFFDGVPVYIGVWNHPLLDILPVNTVERIAVHKSPQPQVFGNAVAAIELVPKRLPEGRASAANARIAAGSFATRIAQADYGSRSGAFDMLLGGGYMRSDGHRDDGDGRLANGLARVGLQLSPNWSVGALALASENEARDPGPENQPRLKNGEYQTRLGLGALTLSHRHDRAQGEIRLYATDGRGYWLRQAGTAGDTLTDWTQRGLRAREQLAPWPDGEVVVGLDVENVRGDVRFRPTNAPARTFEGPTLRIASPYVAVSHRIAVGQWRLTPSVGLRWYDHNTFGSESAPHAGLVLEHGPLALRFNAARGINYPGLDVIVFSQNVIPALGQSWRNLTAERVDHVEVGARYALGRTLSLDLALYRDRGADRYVFVPPPPPPPVFTNRGGATVKGAEATLTWQPQTDRSLFVGVTRQSAAPESLPYTPESSIVAGGSASFGPWRLSADAQYLGSQFVLSQSRSATAVNTQKVGSYALLNARLGYRALRAVELFIAVENLADEDYALRPGYPMPGRSAMFGVSASL
jgi:iron complex outermembrane receptor protein